MLYALYKPPGMTTTHANWEDPSLNDWLETLSGQGGALTAVGRLDKETSGLLLVVPRDVANAVNKALFVPWACSKT